MSPFSVGFSHKKSVTAGEYFASISFALGHPRYALKMYTSINHPPPPPHDTFCEIAFSPCCIDVHPADKRTQKKILLSIHTGLYELCMCVCVYVCLRICVSVCLCVRVSMRVFIRLFWVLTCFQPLDALPMLFTWPRDVTSDVIRPI